MRSDKVSFGKKGFKTFIGYKDAKTLDLYVYIPPKLLQIRKDFDKTKFMFSLIKDDELLEKYSEIWETVKDSLKKQFDSEPEYKK